MRALPPAGAVGASSGALLQQHRAARIDVRPVAVADHRVEIGLAPFGRQHYARQRARIFIDVGILGARDEIEIAGLERWIDLLDRRADGDEAHAEQVFQRRTIRRHQRRELPLVDTGHRVGRVGGALEVHQPQRIVPEQMIEVVNEPDVRPVIGDADQLDAVAAIGRGGGLELRLQQRDGFVRGVRTQRVVLRGLQPGQLVRRVVPAEIGDAEDGQHGRGGKRAANGKTARQHQSADRDRDKSNAPEDRQCGASQHADP